MSTPYQVVVIGDYMVDIDLKFQQIKIAPDHHVPVCVLYNKESRPGAAGAVVEMLRGLNINVLPIGENIKEKSVKKRFFVDGKPVMRADEDCLQELQWDEIELLMETIPSDIEYIIVSDYGKGMITPYLWQLLVQWHKKIIVDPAINKPLSWYEGAYAILPNMAEANVFNISNGFVRCNELIKQYRYVGLKVGKEGILCAERNKRTEHIEGVLVDAIDTCGAGDMVISAIVKALLDGKDWYEACVFANKMAAKKCEQMGSTPVRIEECEKTLL